MQPTETAVFHAASRIYSAYIVSGQVGDQEADAWMKRAIAEAIKMADATDPPQQSIQSSVTFSDNRLIRVGLPPKLRKTSLLSVR